MTNEIERLRRELRATSAVNLQLHAQLEDNTGSRVARRSAPAMDWIEQLATVRPSEASLARADDGTVFVVEGLRKRVVRSGILAAAIEDVLGPPRDAAELETLDEGVPVELFESSVGPPFVVIGGMRHIVVGVPLPHPVDNLHASAFAEGEEINVAAANVARRRFEQAMTGHLQLTRVRGSLSTRGVVGTARTLVRRVTRQAKRMFSD